MEKSTIPPSNTAETPVPAVKSVLTVVYILIVCSFIIIGTVGNVLVLLSVWFFSRLRNWANALIVNLSIADLVVALVTMPTLLVRLFVDNLMENSPELCRLFFQVNLTVVLVSVTTLGISSINRYILITKPRYVYRQYCGRNNIVILLILIWVISLATVFIPPIGLDLINYVPANQFCHFKEDSIIAWWYGSLLLLLYIGVVIGVIIVSSILTFYKITSVRNRVQIVLERSQTSQDAPQRNTLTKQELLVTRMMLFVCLAFCFCMLPYCINHALSYKVYHYPLFFKVCILLILTNSCINPLIYAGSNRFFRASFKKILTFNL